MKKIQTSKIYLGDVEAEQEIHVDGLGIDTFFEDYAGIDNAIALGKFIICGRKGSGKSAFAVCKKRQASKKEQRFVNIIRKNEFALEKLVNGNEKDDHNYMVLFEWLILVRLVKMILDSEIGSERVQIKSLKKFYDRNSGYVNIDQYTIAEIVKGSEVNFAPLKSEFHGFKRMFSAKSVKAPFYKMINPLREAVVEVLRMQIFENASFLTVFDDLDIKFKLTSKVDKDMLMDLIRVAKQYNTDYLIGTSAKVILLLRDDISNRLEGHDGDVAKTFASCAHYLKWYEQDHYGDGRNSLLRKLINRRLKLAFGKQGIKLNDKDPWKDFVVEKINDKPSFKYVLDHTFYLPRDLVGIFKDIGRKNYSLPLGENEINELLQDFAISKKKEICDELVAMYDDNGIKKIIDALAEIDDGYDVSFDETMKIIQKHGLDLNDLKTLIDYSFIVPVDAEHDHFYFSYREKVPQNGLEHYTFRTPYILSLYFKNR